jgi:hypothetical protein
MGESEGRVLTGGEDESRRTSTTEEIRADIERTRAELEETVEAIGDRLKPANIAQKGWESVKNTSGEQASRVVRLAREHPITATLVGAGVTWMLIERARRSREERWVHGESYDDTAYEELGYEGEGGATPVAGVAQDRVRRAARGVSGAARSVGHAASEAGEKVRDIAGSVKDRASDLGVRVRHGSTRARESFWDLVERRPLVAGVAALAAGVVVGMTIPATERESSFMGETRDELFRGVRDAGRRTLDKTKEVARSAAEAAQTAARSEAERQQLVPDATRPEGGARGPLV